jgi:hypothetical protein
MTTIGEHPPGKKYFKGRIIKGERVFHYAIWDGVRNYENKPPHPKRWLSLRVDETTLEDIETLICIPADDPKIAGLVVWTRDHRTYQMIVRRLHAGGLCIDRECPECSPTNH